jgi:hypothetical protein
MDHSQARSKQTLAKTLYNLPTSHPKVHTLGTLFILKILGMAPNTTCPHRTSKPNWEAWESISKNNSILEIESKWTSRGLKSSTTNWNFWANWFRSKSTTMEPWILVSEFKQGCYTLKTLSSEDDSLKDGTSLLVKRKSLTHRELWEAWNASMKNMIQILSVSTKPGWMR